MFASNAAKSNFSRRLVFSHPDVLLVAIRRAKGAISL
jgi:hypothetical protein